MSSSIPRPPRPEVVYPDSDGLPMADNTLQYEWIVTIKGGLDAVFKDDPNVFVAGDLFWYPVEGDPNIVTTPDALVAIGRPKGYRGSYRQWEEGGIAPQVVFEVLSPNNRVSEMERKRRFYEKYGVQEYYLYDPDHNVLDGWVRVNDRFEAIAETNGWTSPVLGIRFELLEGTMRIVGLDGQPFVTFVELVEQRNEAKQEASSAREVALAAQQEASIAREVARAAQQEASAAKQEAARLAARLRELGFGPDV